jgi:putative ABC transport system permease protein
MADEILNQKLQKRPGELWYMDDFGYDLRCINIENGNYPQKENEIVTDTLSLKLLNIDPKIGAEINLDLNIKGQEVNRTFYLSGYWDGEAAISSSLFVVSKKYVNFYCDELSDTYSLDNYASGSVFSDVLFYNGYNINDSIDKLLAHTDYQNSDTSQKKYLDIGVNWAYLSARLNQDATLIIVIGIFILLILMTGYFIINNIFYISLIKDIKIYGLLKIIGTTKRQIYKIIYYNAFLLCLLSIPLGLILGLTIGNLIIPLLLKSTIYAGINTHWHVSFRIIIFSIIFELITVFLSVQKPGKIVAKLSPINAINSSFKEVTNAKKRIGRRKSMPLFLLHFGVSRKKMIKIVISLSLCIILFNSAFSLLIGLNQDKYTSKYIDTDFQIANVNYYNYKYNGANDGVSINLIDELSRQNGFIDGGRIFHTNDSYSIQFDNEPDDVYDAKIYGVDFFNTNSFELLSGEINYEKLTSAPYIIEGVVCDDYGIPDLHSSKIQIGDKIVIKNNDSQEVNEFILLGKVALTSKNSNSIFVEDGYSFFLPTSQYQACGFGQSVMSYVFNTSHIETAEQFLKKYTSDIDPMLDYRSQKTLLIEYNNMIKLIKIVVGGLCIILGIISFINFINAILNSIFERNAELIILKKIGATNRQIRKFIMMETMSYALGTTIMSSILCSIISLVLLCKVENIIWFYDYKFTLLPVIISFIFLSSISVILPRILFNK